MRRRWNKFNNRTQRCLCDHKHDSTLEATYCNRLLALKREGKIKDYEIQKTFHMYVNDVKICQHRVDFLVLTNDEKEEVHEVKGFGTMVWYIKMKLFKALYPHIPYIVIRKEDVYGSGSSRKTRVTSLFKKRRKNV